MTTINKTGEAEDYLKEPPKSTDIKHSKQKSGRDQKDILIARLKNVNMKLRTHLKDLNSKLEIAIDKTHTVKKPTMPTKEADPEEEQKRIDNTRKCIENFKHEIEWYKGRDNKEELETKLEESKKRCTELK